MVETKILPPGCAVTTAALLAQAAVMGIIIFMTVNTAVGRLVVGLFGFMAILAWRITMPPAQFKICQFVIEGLLVQQHKGIAATFVL